MRLLILKTNSLLAILLFTICAAAVNPINNVIIPKTRISIPNGKTATNKNTFFHFHNDSLHYLNFRYPGKRKGIKPFIVPAALITSGTALHFLPEIKEGIRDFSQEKWAYTGKADDYIQYAPLVAVYALNVAGIEGKNNFGNRTAILVKSMLLWNFMVYSLKSKTGVTRPSGGTHSFPSGHTSFAFAMAHFFSHEYGFRSKWYSVAAYSAAATVGVMRVTRNAHWISDVVAGAGFGILSTELIYLTHQYKWDNQHLKNFDIFPFSTNRQKGLTLVYRF